MTKGSGGSFSWVWPTMLVGISALSAMAAPVLGHGAVSMEQDSCRLRLGSHTLHFSSRQPDTSREEFCEDIPSTGRTIFVVDFVDRVLKDLPIAMRIGKDDGMQGEGTTLVFQSQRRFYPSGSIVLEHHFDAPGNYVGVLTAGEGELVATFPFAVGRSTIWRTIILCTAGLIVLGQVAFVAIFLCPKDNETDADRKGSER